MPVRVLTMNTRGGVISAPLPAQAAVWWIGPGMDEAWRLTETSRPWRSHAADRGSHNSRARHTARDESADFPFRRRSSRPGRVIRPDLARRGYELRGSLGPRQVHAAHGSASLALTERPRAGGGGFSIDDLRPARPLRREASAAGARPHRNGAQLRVRTSAHRSQRGSAFY